MSGRPTVKARWIAEVLRSPHITDSVRVLLIVMAEYMTAAGYVTVPRAELADRIGRNPRRVTERIESAKGAGFLQVVRSGRPGLTAGYNATVPAPSHGADGCTNEGCGRVHQPHGAVSSTHRWRTGAPSKTDTHGADGGPASTRARIDSPSVSEGVAVHRDREQRPDHDGTREPTTQVTGGTYRKGTGTRVRVSTQEDEDELELYAVGGAT